MSEPLLTKRLHISGLTPSITPADLQRRLSSFGKVMSMDGFGARDALGDPRKFGFVTMEIGAKELAKCLNVLSGSTWKGAKLRIGEAIPDYRERLAQTNSRPPRLVRPKRTHTRNYGHPSSTVPLTPLTAAAAALTPGWTITPSGRVVRPMRMRPERPLEPTRGELSISKVKGTSGKAKKRVKPPPARARRRLIDPTKWDSVYLKGIFLDDVSLALPASNNELRMHHDQEDEGERDENSTVSSSPNEDNPFQNILQSHQDPADTNPSSQQLQEVPLAASSPADQVNGFMDIRGETDAALAILDRMFGDDDWNGRESVGEMDDSGDNGVRGKEPLMTEDDGLENSPLDSGKIELGKTTREGNKKLPGETNRPNHGRSVVPETHSGDVEMGETSSMVGVIEAPPEMAEPVLRTNLKALFAPREEAPFSLLDHLDLDLELDTDILGIGVTSSALQEYDRPSEPALPTSHITQMQATASTTKAHSRITLDPSFPLLFPPLDSLPHPYNHSCGSTTKMYRRDTLSCILFPSPSGVRGLHPLSSSTSFTRSSQDTSESIRERWEKDKSSLTHEWKKAWREARGSRRGRGGTGVDVGLGSSF